jgi:hypothetical protein
MIILGPEYKSKYGGCVRGPVPANVRHFNSLRLPMMAASLPVKTNNLAACLAAGLTSIVQQCGCCTGCAAAYGTTICAFLSGQPLINLSELFCYWVERYPNNTEPDFGGTIAGGILAAQFVQVPPPYAQYNKIYGGMPERFLWPQTLLSSPPGQDDQPYKATALAMTPGAPVVADSAYHGINANGYAYLGEPTTPGLLDMIKTAIASNFPVCFGIGDHALCALDYDDSLGLLICVNSEGNPGPQPGPFGFEYSTITGNTTFNFMAVTSATVSQAPVGVTVTQDWINSVGTIVGDAMGANGMPTLSLPAWEQLQALVVAAGGTVPTPPPPPPPPPPGNPSPDGTIVTAPGVTATDVVGNVWSLAAGSNSVYGPAILLNGAIAGTGMAVLIEINHGGVAYFKNGLGNWYTYSGSAFHASAAP